jgi:hypothetical protein
LPYLAKLEKAGIPATYIVLDEEIPKVCHDAALHGIPTVRYITGSRLQAGPEDVERIYRSVMDSLIQPLNDDEKKSGLYAPREPRILFEGTLEEAEEFYNQVEYLPGILNAPFSKYTDGLPVVIPTEERVEAMLKGTSHKPDEIIAYQKDWKAMDGMHSLAGYEIKKGDPVTFLPIGRVATVEQIAVNAVMAGCKPEQFPIVLAIAESGGATGDGRGEGGAFIVSGPIYKEVGMNVSYGRFNAGNPTNKVLGRVGALIWRNIGGYKESVNTIMTYGNAITNGGLIFAEYAEGLPPEWEGLNEELGFKKDESVLMPIMPLRWGIGQENAPGVYRSLQKSGHGAIARFLGVKGLPGPHNYLDFLIHHIWDTMEGGFSLVITPSMAVDLVNLGFKSKREVYEYIWKKSFQPLKEYRNRGAADYWTNGWTGIEPRSGKPWKELPDDYMVPAGGPGPDGYCIIVCDGQETTVDRFSGGHGRAYSIDVWK